MANFCGNCGSPLNSTAFFCGSCGSRIAEAAPTAPAPAPPIQPTPAFNAVPPAIAPAPQPDAGFSSVPASFLPAPAPPDSVGFSAVPAAFTPAPVTQSDVGFTSVPASFPATPATPEPGFTSLPAAYVPPPVVPVAASAPDPSGYAPVGSNLGPTSVPYTQTVGVYPPPAPAYPTMQAAAAYPARKSNTLLKVIVAFVLLLFVLGALALAGLWYAAQKIKAKAHTVTTQVRFDPTARIIEVSGWPRSRV